ncbi:testin [Cyclopterus lumpus]|uniref:Testin n=1 Tax=Cyclopterus lumpus TaxID=8103 RepID=A0A8C2XRI2_CYCLU|nr:testin [Cyclopterus lumpus]
MEIEKEVKKMTLGHEFGAGAACLKCKDKCEGFELHFWRKICRNCKCGLTEHNVQMNSEENKKVGKLFEDTKYTGLIAKLKTDGIPSYSGSMVTITLPSSGTAYAVAPPSAGAGVAQPAGGAAGPAPSGPRGQGQGQAQGQAWGQGQPQGQGQGQAWGQGQPQGQAQGQAWGQGQPQGQGQGQAWGQAQGQAQGQAWGQPQGQAQGQAWGQPQGQAQGQAWGQGQPQGQTQGQAWGQPQGQAQGQAWGQAQVPASLTPVGVNRVPVAVGATSANLVPVSKDVPMKSVTYEWAPPVANKYLAVRYIELLPPEKRPVAGTEGAAYRRQQMARQLPEHDQDPSRCHELSPAEVKLMEQFVRKYKDEALGVGDVVLPEEMALAQAGGAGVGAPGARGAGFGPGTGAAAGSGPGAAGAAAGPTAGAGGGAGSGPGAAGRGVGAGGAGPLSGPGTGPPAAGAMGTAGAAGAMAVPGAQQAGPPQRAFSCHHCQRPMRVGEPAVYAERAGYDKMWHPACFVCCTCEELLVDMIYFWKKGKLFCGRHYGDSEKPRCGGCDELIFSNEYTQAEGQNWHLKHFCCFDCDCVLAGETYVMESDKPVCQPCYMESYAVKCAACQKPVEPEAQRVSYGEHHWHAEPRCFKCSGCSTCLVGQRFMAQQGSLFCSVECKKKTAA